MIKKIQSFILDLSIAIITIFVCTFGLLIAFSSNLIIKIVAKSWSYLILIAARIICGIKAEVQNEEIVDFVNKNSHLYNFIIVSKHQSIFETVFFINKFKKPAYVLKKELLKLPFYGIFAKLSGMIGVDRKGGVKEVKDMILKIKDRLQNGHQVIIFPQGTRLEIKNNGQYNYENLVKYKWSFLKALENEKKTSYIIPIAINTGLFWPKGFLRSRKSGSIKIKIGNPIKFNGIFRNRTKYIIENWIENETFKLINNLV